MKRILPILIALVISTALAGVALAQDHHSQKRIRKPGKQGYFFLPPRNYFYLYPNHYPPFRLHADRYYPRRYSSRYDRYRGRHYGDSYYYDERYYEDDLYYPDQYGIYTIYTQSPLRSEIVHSNSSNIVFRVSPREALVYIDDKLIGSARDFEQERDRYMVLEGEHELRIEYPGFQTFDTVMEVIPNKTIHLDIELQPLP
ncbi:MAG TPA: PEGA domain-containing protein [Acidobacteriota bacterium]|nr:PEGA domain-containing protein [Acidobacteriota bacterium]